MINDFHNAGLAIVANRKLLVVKPTYRTFCLLPGGQIDPNEIPEDTAIRELGEELGIVIDRSFINEDLGIFTSQAKGFSDKRMIHFHCFLITRELPIPTLKTDSEIESSFWVDSHVMNTLELGSIITEYVIPLLVKRNLVN